MAFLGRRTGSPLSQTGAWLRLRGVLALFSRGRFRPKRKAGRVRIWSSKADSLRAGGVRCSQVRPALRSRAPLPPVAPFPKPTALSRAPPTAAAPPEGSAFSPRALPAIGFGPSHLRHTVRSDAAAEGVRRSPFPAASGHCPSGLRCSGSGPVLQHRLPPPPPGPRRAGKRRPFRPLDPPPPRMERPAAPAVVSACANPDLFQGDPL